jgi:hypothetical protein
MISRTGMHKVYLRNKHALGRIAALCPRLFLAYLSKHQELYLGPVEACRLESDLWGLSAQGRARKCVPSRRRVSTTRNKLLGRRDAGGQATRGAFSFGSLR